MWRSPGDQPAWARPALLVVAAMAGLSYSWGINSVILESFYGGAARSMSQSWHNFFFGAFDPWGTVSVDKLPGAFWVQALSLRLFGFHVWAIALPQAVEGVLTVLVLYRVVRRVAGAGAGLAAAAVLAATPVTILLNRGNISDSLLILLLVLAADAATRAFLTGRLVPLLVAGVWVGLAFQTKMLQAWLVLPALFLTYVLAAPISSLYRRLGHVALAALVVLVVSMSWMSVVSFVPAHDRPYVDGSCDNSVFSQVFLYNGADRLSGNVLDQPGCSAPTATSTSAFTAHTVPLSRGPGRFLSGPFGLDAAWTLVPALVSLAGILLVRRRAPRTDPLRAAAVLWLLWLFFVWTFFADATFLNAYYLAALAPPLAALCGMGLALAWHARPPSRAVTLVVMATVVGGVAFALSLVPADVGIRPWIVATTVLAAASAVALLALSLRKVRPSQAGRAGLVLAAIALLLGPAWACATVVSSQLGAFDTVYQSAAFTAREHATNQRAVASWPALAASAAHDPADVSVDTEESSAAVAFDVLGTGREFLPVGGFTGQVPSISLPRFVADVHAGRISWVLVASRPPTRNPDLRWVTVHCPPAHGSPLVHWGGDVLRRYLCAPVDAAG
jgi:4-amino-4-deoxy-L-arabinose transferase-like glycosyltransferase